MNSPRGPLRPAPTPNWGWAGPFPPISDARWFCMELVEQILGNMSDEAWRDRLVGADVDVDWLELGQWDAQKNRLRKTTNGGREIAVSLDRGRYLRDGDVLVWDEASRQAVVARIHLCDVMVVSLLDLAHRPAADVMETCVKLGHALGNQHWPAVIRDNAVYVPMSVDRKVMEAVMETHQLKDISYSFMDGDKVAAMLDPQETRRLFGGTEMPADGHTHGHEHAHGPDDGHKHGHHHKHHGHHHGPHGRHHEHRPGEACGCACRTETR